MKLIKCNVRNFGTLKDFSADFNGGLTVIKEENGFGKSTLAVFLKAMLYGLPQTSKRNINENDRKKFDPWQGGVYGGSLDFEHGGKRYRVERTFASKEKDDTFRLLDLDSGAESGDFSSDLGVELFGIDADSFERSVYLPQSEISTEMNNGLRAKLTGLIENSDDIGNFDSAVKALEKSMRFYSVANGARGRIAELDREIERVRTVCNDAAAASRELSAVTIELEQIKQAAQGLDAKKAQLRKRITAASDAAALAEQNRQRAELSASLEQKNARLRELAVRYPCGPATEQELQKISVTLQELNSARARFSALESDNAVLLEKEKLDGFFGGTVPTEQELAEVKAIVLKLTQLRSRLEAIKPQIAEEAQKKPTDNKLAFRLNLIFAVLLIAAGAVTLIWQTAVGLCILLAGVIDLGAAGFIYLKNMISSAAAGKDTAALKAEYDALSAEAEQLSGTVNGFVSKYVPNTPFDSALETVAEALRDLKRVEAALTERERQRREYRETVSELFFDADAFFSNYGVGIEGEYADRLVQIRRDTDELVRLEEELKKLGERVAQLPQKTDETAADTAVDRDALLNEEKQLLAQLDTALERKVALEKEFDRLTAQSQALPEAEERLEGLCSERAEAAERFKVVSLTLELLKQAKNDLSLRYLDRVTDGFKKYLKVLGVEGDECLVDTDLHIQLGREGAAREKSYFSSGLCDMIDIAMRLSLSDALFEKDSTVLILDDPFVNLDDERLKNAMTLLRKLASRRQIVYLTCHSSRT